MRKLEGGKAVVSVPSQRKAWEVYPLEVYYPDDRAQPAEGGLSLVLENAPSSTTSKCHIFNWHIFPNC